MKKKKDIKRLENKKNPPNYKKKKKIKREKI